MEPAEKIYRNPNLVVTTSFKAPNDIIIREAEMMAAKLNAPFQKRDGKSLQQLKEEFHAQAVLVVAQEKMIVHTDAGQYFFHLSMAELRIKNLLNGKNDHMIDAMSLTPGMTVLDATLGLGTDAIVASFVAGQNGAVSAIESSPVIALVTGAGLQKFSLGPEDLGITAALRRISVQNADYLTHLKSLPDKSFDIVYFDPMFRRPVEKSSNLTPLRILADPRPLTQDAVTEACRAAKKRVVMKEANNSSEFAKLGFANRSGGKYSSVQYGVIECGV